MLMHMSIRMSAHMAIHMSIHMPMPCLYTHANAHGYTRVHTHVHTQALVEAVGPLIKAKYPAIKLMVHDDQVPPLYWLYTGSILALYRLHVGSLSASRTRWLMVRDDRVAAVTY